MKQSVKEKTILVLTKPPKVVYPNVKVKFGEARDYAENLKSNVFNSEPCKESTFIPKELSDKDVVMQEQNT